ncbi:MAG TPA: multicopper oxidase domain-containing protein [Longimicrobiales bacterium]|nr:multicopper oxidase domain-containing protein [Longimicrobiales bacterium]
MKRMALAPYLVSSMVAVTLNCQGFGVVADHPTTRTYYVAADEVDWNYVPADSDLTFGRPLPKQVYAIENAPPVMATTFHKAVYHRYTDSTFTTRMPRPPKWRHLGILGPVLRGAVGDTIVVIFRNNTSFPASMHPHGVSYTKSSEGALYSDGTSGADKLDDSVPPGGTHRYVWPIPERAGPGPNDPSSIIWPYHSHTDELRDVYTGLIGAIIVTRRGMARPDGSPRDVDREFVTLFASFNENNTHFTAINRKRYLGDTTLMGPKGPRLFHQTQYHTINGLMYGNAGLDAFTMRQGERVRWYLFSSTGFDDFHTPHWHGNTVLVHGQREDVVDLSGPLKMLEADMVADNPGIWLFHCHFGEHTVEGMSTRYRVLPVDSAGT